MTKTLYRFTAKAKAFPLPVEGGPLGRPDDMAGLTIDPEETKLLLFRHNVTFEELPREGNELRYRQWGLG